MPSIAMRKPKVPKKHKINRKGKSSQPSKVQKKIMRGHSEANKANKKMRSRLLIERKLKRPTMKDLISRRDA